MKLLSKLILLLLLVPLVVGCASSGPARAVSLTNAEQCVAWFEKRGLSAIAQPGAFLSIDRSIACFDGAIEKLEENKGTRALALWAAAPAQGSARLLVIRSHGGDAEVALGIAEDLQRHSATVLAHSLCASSCANYIFSGVVDRRVTPETLILFHGGFSDQSRRRIERSLDELYARAADQIADPAGDRRRLMDSFESSMMRQDTLLRDAGVDPAIIHSVDANLASNLPPELCGGDTTMPRNFVYFGPEDADRMGLVLTEGTMPSNPKAVNQRIAQLGRSFVACRLPVEE